MSKQIDQRVVEMQFENGTFQKNCNETISSLDKLKKALDFSGSAGSFNEIEKASNRVDMSGLGNAVETVQAKFSTFELVVANVLGNIATTAINTGAQFVKSLSVDQILGGWGKYDQAIASEQILMSSLEGKIDRETGEEYDLDGVLKRLEKITWYSDETSYNISQMNAAIGDFTSADVDLDVSIETILGLSNACADAGVSTEKAQYAYTAFAKAIGSGTMTLGVWNQQLKTSGLTNSSKFKQAMIDAGLAVGNLVYEEGRVVTAGKKTEVTLSNIADTLNEGWATTTVMIESLSGYSDTVNSLYSLTTDGKLDESSEVIQNLTKALAEQGKTLEDVGLDEGFETASQAIEALTKAYEDLGLEVPKSLKAFSRAQEAISFSQAIDSVKVAVSSGFAQTFETIFGNYETAKSLWTVLANDLYDIFVTAGNTRNEILDIWAENGGQELFVEALKQIFDNLVNIKSAIDEGIGKIFGATTEERAEKLLKITQKFSDWVSNLTDQLQEGEPLYDKISRIAAGVAATFNIIKNILVALIKPIGALFGEFNGLGGSVLDTMVNIGDYMVSLNDTINASGKLEEITETLSGFYSKLGKVIRTVATTIREAFGIAWQYIKQFWTSITNGDGLSFDDVKSMFSDLGGKILEVFNAVYEWFASTKLGSKIIDMIDKVKTKAQEAIEKFKQSEFGAWIIRVATNVKNGIGSIIESISELNVGGSLIQSFFEIVKYAWSIGSKVFETIVNAVKSLFSGMNSEFDNGSLLDNVKTFIKLLLAFDLVKIATTITGSLTSITKGISEALWYLEADSLKDFATAMLMLVGALVLLAAIDTDKLTAAVIAMGVLWAELAIAFNYMYGLESKNIGEAIANFIDAKSFQQQIAAFANLIMKFAIAVLILSVSMKILGSMSWEELAKAGVGLLGITVILVTSAKILSSNKSAASKAGKTMTSLALAIGIMVLIGKQIAKMSWDELEKAGAGLLGISVILVASAKILSSGDTSFGKAGASFLLFIPAIAAMAGIAKLLATMSWEELGKAGAGLLGISVILVTAAMILSNASAKAILGAAAMTVMAVAIGLLTPSLILLSKLSWTELLVGLIAVAGAIVIFGAAGLLLEPAVPGMLAIAAACLAFGAAVALVGAGLALAGVGLSAAAAAFELFTIVFLAGGPKIIEGVQLILEAFIGLIPAIIIAIGQGIVDLIVFLGDNIPLIVGSVVKIISAILDALILLIPKFLELVSTIVIGICNLLVELSPILCDTGVALLLDVLHAIDDNIQEVVETGISIAVNFIEGIAAKIDDVIQAGVDLALSFIQGVADALNNDENHEKVKKAFRDLLKGVVKTVMTGFELLQIIKEEAMELGKKIIAYIIEGIKEKAQRLVEAVKLLGTDPVAALEKILGINSPSKVYEEIGMYSALGMAKGIEKHADETELEARKMAKNSLTAVAETMANIADVIDDNMDIQPTITPIVDLSQVQNGAADINAMMNDEYSIGLAGNASSGFNKLKTTISENSEFAKMAEALQSFKTEASTVMSNTFNITGDDPKSIAEEVSKIIQTQVERRDAVWA